MALATRIAVMDKGRIVQYAPPIEIYRRPATTFVANFVGNPPMNLLPVAAGIEGGRLHLLADGLLVSRCRCRRSRTPASGSPSASGPSTSPSAQAGRQHHRRRALRQREHGSREARDPRARRTPPASPPASSPTRRSPSARRVTLSFETRPHHALRRRRQAHAPGRGRMIRDAPRHRHARRRRDPYFYLPFDVPEGTTRIDVDAGLPEGRRLRHRPRLPRPARRPLAGARRLSRLERRRARRLLRRHRRRHAGLRPRPDPAGPLAGDPRPLQAPARRRRGRGHGRARRRARAHSRRSPRARSRSGPARAGTGATSTATPSTPTPAARPSCCTPPPGRPGSTSSPSPTTTP